MNTVPEQENPHAEVIGWHITAALNPLFMAYAPGVRWIPGYDGHALRARLSHALGEIATVTGQTAPTWEHDGRSWCLQGALPVHLGDTSITVNGTEVLAASDVGPLVWLQLPSAAVVMDEIRHGGPLRDPYEIVHTLAEQLEAPSTVKTRDQLVALLTAEWDGHDGLRV